jgi:hypothetical protein
MSQSRYALPGAVRAEEPGDYAGPDRERQVVDGHGGAQPRRGQALLVVHLDGDLYIKIIQEYRLDWSSRTYRLAQTHMDDLSLQTPFAARIQFSEINA